MAQARGTATKSYISAIALLDTREINPNEIDIQNEMDLTDIAGIMGNYKETSQAIFHHYSNQAMFTQGVVTGTPTGNGSKATPLSVTLSTATSGFARKNDLAKLPDGKVAHVVNQTQAAGADTVSLVSVNGSALTAAAADKISFFSSASGESGDSPANRTFSKDKFYNLIQIFDEVNEETDIQSMSAIEVKYKGQDRIAVKNLADKFLMLKAKVNAAFIGGQLSTTQFSDTAPNLVDPIGGGPVQTTRGLDEATVTYGVNDQVGTLDSFAYADIEDLVGQLIAKKTPKKFMGYTPTKVQLKFDSTFKGQGSSGVQSGLFSLDGKTFDFNVQKVSVGHFEFNFTPLGILDHQELFTNTDIVKSAYFIPVGNASVAGGGSEPYLQIRYMKHNIRDNEGNKIWAEWHTGALAPTGATSSKRVWHTDWITYQGPQFAAPQHMAKMRVLA